MRLTIQTDEGPQLVQAKRYTLLAIHRRPDFNSELYPDQWTLSHIPTGLTLLKELSLEEAIQLAQALEGLDWQFQDDTIPQQVQEQAIKIIEQLKSKLRHDDVSALSSAVVEGQT
jgi:hypothetical protein